LPLETLGLEGAIRSFIDMHDSNCGLLIEFNVSGESRKLPSSTEYTLLMVTRAAINNAIKHSSATSISVDLIFNSRYTLLKISDDGDGIKTESKDEGTGMGITNMKERIEAENGKFRLISSKKGTTVEAKVPYFMN
jgi:two-component system NarL family sensor kinase